MSKPEMGAKRQCLSCAAKFFDMNRDPIACPRCGAIFQIAAARMPARALPASGSDEIEPVDPGVELVALEEADGAEAKVIEGAEDEIVIDDDEDADADTFLEEEEEDNDDVADLIDGDLEKDEET